QSIEGGAHVEARLVFGVCVTGCGERRFRRSPIGVELGEHRLDLRVAFGDLGLEEIVCIERVAERERMLRAVIPGQRLADSLLRFLAPNVSVLREDAGITDTSHDCSNDLHSGYARDVADDV